MASTTPQFFASSIKDVIDILSQFSIDKDKSKACHKFDSMLDRFPFKGAKGRKGKKSGGAETSTATGSSVYNLEALGIGAGAGPYASVPAPTYPTSTYVNAPTAFSAGVPQYGSVEHGLLSSITNATSGGLLLGGAATKTKKKRVAKK